jgi:hypothetical protein
MRKVIDMQMQIGEVAIADIEFDLQSRDEIPKLLIGLKSIYCNRQVRQEVSEVLMDLVPDNVDPNNGRNGMILWRILVLGTLRLSCNWDYDKLKEIANEHKTLRLMLGHGVLDQDYRYALQTLKDNVSLFTPKVFDRVNQIVVNYGHEVIGKKPDEELRGSCDSFVVETDVHFPTDINVLFDALRRTIVLIMKLCAELGWTDWRQGVSNIKKARKCFNKTQGLKRSRSKDDKKKAEKDQLIINAHLVYLQFASSLINKARATIASISSPDIVVQFKIEEILGYIAHGERQVDQIRRRAVEGETIPHHEKVFSVFEEHTEWIKKGKPGVVVELGLRVSVVKDQFGFILHHRVMENETDDMVAVPIIIETKDRFPSLNSCSFDKGYHSPDNQRELAQLLDKVILPRKGKLSAINKEIENSEEFKEARRKHSAVESSINALENHGLDRCRDHGIDGFKRYVGLAVLARNIQIIGHIIQQRELKRLQKLEKKERNKLRACS